MEQTQTQCGAVWHGFSLGLQELLLAEVVQGFVLVSARGEVPSPPRTATGGCNGEVE